MTRDMAVPVASIYPHVHEKMLAAICTMCICLSVHPAICP